MERTTHDTVASDGGVYGYARLRRARRQCEQEEERAGAHNTVKAFCVAARSSPMQVTSHDGKSGRVGGLLRSGLPAIEGAEDVAAEGAGKSRGPAGQGFEFAL